MGVYFGTTEITNVDWIPGDKDITQVFFATNEVFTVWAEYDGTLPAQYSANGGYLADYRIYGSAGGVGDATSGTEPAGYKVPMSVQSENLFDPNAMNPSKGYIGSAYIRQFDGAIISDSLYYISEYIAVEENAKYTWVFSLASPTVHSSPTAECLDMNYNIISFVTHEMSIKQFDFVTPQGCKYIRASVFRRDKNDSMLYYNATIPIYIGSSPLEEDEYMDYGAGKIYRVINIFDKESQDIQLGKAIDRNGNLVDDPAAAVSGLIDISGFSDLYIKGVSSGGVAVRYVLYTGESLYVWHVIGDENAHVKTNGADHIRITVLQSCLDTAVISPYSTPQPQDPPVPLPQLPTVDGTNIVDYAGQSAAVPSRFVAKYRKEGF